MEHAKRQQAVQQWVVVQRAWIMDEFGSTDF
jgi:hypothetical protein